MGMPVRKFFKFTLILGFSGELMGDLHHIFKSLCCQRGVTRHPNTPPSDAYAFSVFRKTNSCVHK